MKNLYKRVICIVISIIFLLNIKVLAINEENKNNLYYTNTKRDLLVLMLAYSKYINTLEKDDKGQIYLVMNSGTKILYDDKKEKNPNEKLANPDLQDMLENIYPLEQIHEVRPDNEDPGRNRVYPLLNAVYGNGMSNITRNLTNSNTKYGNFQFNKENDAAENLKKAFNLISEAAKNNPSILAYVTPISGTFNYRVISGTSRLSAHAYGIAIDIRSNSSDYWKWVSKEKGSKRIASYPNEVVKAFEENGFVWGGKWNHFDILHYEYRPEIILKAKYFRDKIEKNADKWYDGAPNTDEVMEKIKIIDEKLS